MTLKIIHTRPQVPDTERPVPRWAMRLAYALPLLLLPSCLWRLPFAVHFEMGQVQELGMPPYWVSIPYVVVLSVLSEVTAILAIGLVRGWGEVAPAWIPVIGGKRVRPLAAVVPAAVGGLILTALFTSVPIGERRRLTLFGVTETVEYSNSAWQALATVCVSPTAVWGPAIIALTIAYYRRRRPGATPTGEREGARSQRAGV